MSSDAGAAVTAAIFAYPRNEDERATRIYYAGVFVMAKSVALALTFIPPGEELAKTLLVLSVANLGFSFLLDACARRETKRWAGEQGSETYFYHCLLETVLGSWATHKLLDGCFSAYKRIATGKGAIHLEEAANDAGEEESTGILSSLLGKEKDPLEKWASDISWAYSLGMLVKKALATAIVILRFLYDRWQQDTRLDVAARILSSFVSLVLVDILDGLAKEESRLRSTPVRTGLTSKIMSWFT